MTRHTCEDHTEAFVSKLPLERIYEILRDRSRGSERKLALLSLRRRSDIAPDEARRIFRATLDDEGEAPALRVAAAVEIARQGGPEATDLLTRALSVARRQEAPQPVLRSIADQLLRSGAEVAGEIPRMLASDPELLATLRFPLAVNAFRRNLEAPRIEVPPPAKLLDIPEKGAEPIRFSSAGPEAARAIVERAEDLLPGLRFDPEAATAIDCGGQRLAFQPVAGALNPQELEMAGRERKILGVVSVFYDLESEAWDPKYLVVSQPSPNGGADLMLLTTTGALAWASPFRVEGSTTAFTLRPVDRSGAQLAEIAGSVADGQLRFTEARSLQRKHRKRTPAAAIPGQPGAGPL
jgi:hypothetical protein